MLSVSTFLAQIIDYAGLFPPASLALEQAIRNYAGYQHSRESWMLGRFVCPIARLSELDPFISLFTPQTPLALSALASKNPNPASFLNDLRIQLTQLSTFNTKHDKCVSADAIEILIPTAHATKDTFTQIADLINSVQLNGLQPFYEIDLGSRWDADTGQTLDSIQAQNGLNPHNQTLKSGFKLRTGGVTRDAFPTPEQVAFVIAACHDRAIPLKFTAGLHHPIRHFDSGLQTHMYGFLNVFTSGLIAYAQNLPAKELIPILEDEDPTHFSFTDSGLAWRDLSVTTEQIVAARQLVTSFGSCSFDEPRDDLRALNML